MEVFAIVLLLAAFAFYMLPAVVAAQRKHHQANAIAAVNLFFGWTLIGWVGCLIWALTEPLSVEARAEVMARAFTRAQANPIERAKKD